MRKLADTVGNNDETNMSNPAVAVGRPDFQAFAALPKGALHTAANVQPGMRIPPEDLQRLASTHPDANIRARAQLVLDIAHWRANRAAAAGSQTLEKAAMYSGNKYLEKVASFGVFAKNTAEDLAGRSPSGILSDIGRFKDQLVRSRDSRIAANKEWRETGTNLDHLGKVSTQGLQGVGANQSAIMYALNKRRGLGGKTIQEYDAIRGATRNHNVKGIYDL